jgi:hypothetical protein
MVMFLLMLTLTAAKFNTCKQDLQKVIRAIPQSFAAADKRDDYANMVNYSGKGVNDLGHYESCRDMENAKYMLISPAPVIHFALCVPVDCNEGDIREILTDVIYRGGHTNAVSFIRSHI